MIMHKCSKCRYCFNCHKESCSTNLEPYNIKESIEDGWIVKRCPYCNEILEKFETLELLEKNQKEKNNEL